MLRVRTLVSKASRVIGEIQDEPRLDAAAIDSDCWVQRTGRLRLGQVTDRHDGLASAHRMAAY